MNNMYSKILFYQIILSLLFTSCKKDTSPIGTVPQPDRPTTGEAILTGHLYYDYYENQPAINSKVIIFFYNDYNDTLAVAEIDPDGKYYIDNLPEDTIDILVAQPFYGPVLITAKICDIALQPDTNEVNMGGIFTESFVDHFSLVPDHFMVIFDSTSQQTAIDSLNAYHDILSTKIFTSFINRDYYFLEIDPTRDVLPLIDIYQKSDLTLEAGPVFYDPFKDTYHWSVGELWTRLKDWVPPDQVEILANEFNLDFTETNDHYTFRLTKNTPMIQEKLRFTFNFCPLFKWAHIEYDQTIPYSPAPWD